jgi:hypothetical protein
MLPVGNFLSNFSVQPFSGRWEISNMTNTLKDSALLELYLSSDPVGSESLGVDSGGNLLASNYNVYKGFASYTRYIRSKGLPLTMDDVGFTDLTDDQQKLFLSLLAGLTILK